jgi:hypothetical protein
LCQINQHLLTGSDIQQIEIVKIKLRLKFGTSNRSDQGDQKEFTVYIVDVKSSKSKLPNVAQKPREFKATDI